MEFITSALEKIKNPNDVLAFRTISCENKKLMLVAELANGETIEVSEKAYMWNYATQPINALAKRMKKLYFLNFATLGEGKASVNLNHISGFDFIKKSNKSKSSTVIAKFNNGDEFELYEILNSLLETEKIRLDLDINPTLLEIDEEYFKNI